MGGRRLATSANSYHVAHFELLKPAASAEATLRSVLLLSGDHSSRLNRLSLDRRHRGPLRHSRPGARPQLERSVCRRRAAHDRLELADNVARRLLSTVKRIVITAGQLGQCVTFLELCGPRARQRSYLDCMLAIQETILQRGRKRRVRTAKRGSSALQKALE